MAIHTRRRVLQLMSTGFLGLAGCLDRFTGVGGTRLEQLQVINFDHEAHTVHVEVTDDDETVYDDVVDVAPADEESTEWRDGGWGEAAFTDYPTEPGAYAVHTWRGDQSREDRRTLDLREYDQSCVEINVHIGDPDREEIRSEVSIWRSFHCSDAD